MRQKLHLLFLAAVLMAQALWVEAKIITLKSGTSLEGEVLDETETTVTIRLTKGTHVNIDKKDIEAIEEIPPTPTPSEDEALSNEPSPMKLELRKGDPTPTPIPIVPISVRFRRVEFTRTKKDAVPIIAGQGQEDTAHQDHSEEEKGEVIGHGKPFGRVLCLDEGNKYKIYSGSWYPLRNGQDIQVGDRVNASVGRVEVQALDGAKIGFYGGAVGQMRLAGVAMEKGKSWVEYKGEKPFTLEVQGVQALLKSATMAVEFLKSGFKMTLLSGEARFLKTPEGTLILDRAVAPKMFLVGAERTLLSQPQVPAQTFQADLKNWEADFQIASAKAASEAGPSEAEIDPEAAEELAALNKVAMAIKNFCLDLNHFPSETPPVLKDLFESPGDPKWKGPYLTDLTPPLRDRWGTEIHYETKPNPDKKGVYAEILSFGPDKISQDGKGDDLGLIIAEPVE
jgi:hypothetical protein